VKKHSVIYLLLFFGSLVSASLFLIACSEMSSKAEAGTVTISNHTADTIRIFAPDTLVFQPRHLPANDSVLVFRPNPYISDKTYPMLFLLHGWSGNYRHWSEMVDLQFWADSLQFIIVTPDGLTDSWYMNSPVVPGMQYHTFFFEQLYPTLRERYQGIDTTNIYISGLSMGGFGALHLMLRHPKFFRAAGSTSGGVDLYPHKKKWGMAKYIGKKESTYHSLSPINNLQIAVTNKIPVFIDCGYDDVFIDDHRKLIKKVKKENWGDYITVKLMPGSHNADYWKKSVLLHFAFYDSLYRASR